MQSIGFQFSGKCFIENHRIYLCCRESKHNKCEDIADLYKEVPLEVTKMFLFDSRGISAQDRAELKVSECLKFYESEGCGARDSDKAGRSTIGELARTRVKEVINSFPKALN